MNPEISKEDYLKLYNLLPYDYKSIIINTFRCLVNHNSSFTEKGYQPYAISELINYNQQKLGYTDEEVCEIVYDLFNKSNPKSDKVLTIETYRKIKQRNTQTSQRGTNWLEYIAQALRFDSSDYKKYLTDAGIQHAYSAVEKQSNEINSIYTLFDLLNFKEKSALTQLTTGLLNLYMNAYNKIN